MHQKGYVGWVGGNKYKGRQLYSFTIKGFDGFFSCGTDNPNVNKGDHIEFDYNENNGSYHVDGASLRKIQLDNSPMGGAAQEGGGGKPPYGAGNGRANGKPSYWDSQERIDRDRANDEYKRENDLRIQLQSARNAAISWIGVLVGQSAVKLPEKNRKEVLDGLLADYTDMFDNQIKSAGKAPVEGDVDGDTAGN